MKVCPKCSAMVLEDKRLDKNNPIFVCSQCGWRGFFGFKNRGGGLNGRGRF